MSPLARTTLDGFGAFADRCSEVPTLSSAAERKKLAQSELAADVERRRRFLANLPTVISPVIKRLSRELERLVFENSERAPGDKVSLGFQGVAGVGKTTAILHVVKQIHNQAILEHGTVIENGQVRTRHVPVLYSTAPSVQSFKQIIGSILRPFDAGVNGNADAMVEQLLHLLHAARTQVVVVDDAHAVRARNKNGRVTADSIKALMNRIPATVVFVGTGLENSVFFGSTGGGIDDPAAQLSCRMVNLEHPRYRRPSTEDPGEFVKLVAALERPISAVLERHRAGTLTSPKTVRWLFDCTEGVTARMAKWLSAAAVSAVGNGEQVNRALLEMTPLPGRSVAS